MLKSNTNNIDQKNRKIKNAKQILKRHKRTVCFCFLLILAILISIFVPSTNSKSTIKDLYDGSRINKIINYDELFYNSFAFSLDDENKYSLKYNAKDTFFHHVFYDGSTPKYVFGFKEYDTNDLRCNILYDTELTYEAFENNNSEFKKHSKSLIYNIYDYDGYSTYFYYQKTYKKDVAPFYTTYVITANNGYKHLVSDFINAISKEVSYDDKTEPFLRDKVTCTNISNCSLKSYKVIGTITPSNIILADENGQYTLTIGIPTAFTCFDVTMEKYSESMIDDNIYYDSSTYSFLFLTNKQFCRLDTEGYNYNNSLAFVNKNFIHN